MRSSKKVYTLLGKLNHPGHQLSCFYLDTSLLIMFVSSLTKLVVTRQVSGSQDLANK